MTDASEAGDQESDPSPGGSPVERARHVWSIGSYESIAPDFLPMAAHLIRVADVAGEDRVLDLACGTGNAAITAARRGARVTGVDVTPSLLEAARENAAVAGVDVDWREGDVANLPFEDDAFDVTISCVGHVFAEPPDATARELLRVTRPGGRVAFTSWTPESVVPAMGAAFQPYLPADPDPSPPPFAWGDPDVVADRLGDGVDDLVFETGTVLQPTMSPAHLWKDALRDSGMFIVAVERVEEADRSALRRDVIEAIDRYFDDAENAVGMGYRVASARVV